MNIEKSVNNFPKVSVLGISCTAFFSVTFGKLPAKGSNAYRTVALAPLLAGTSTRGILKTESKRERRLYAIGLICHVAFKDSLKGLAI